MNIKVLKFKNTILIITLTVLILIFSGCNTNSKLSTYNFFAMDTIFSLTILESESDNNDDIQAEAEKLHSLFDVRNDESDLAKINNNPNTFIDVDQLTYELLLESVDIANNTGGIFDPTVGPLVDLWAIENKIVPNDDDITEALHLVDYNSLEFNDDDKSVKINIDGAQLDLGAIAKGFAVKKELEILKNNDIDSALISAGGCNYGLGTKPDGSLWKLGIQHPRINDQIIGYVEISNMAVDTSGDYERFFMKDDIRYHHIIDLRTGYPAKGLTSVTVVSPDSVKADALATALFVMGVEKATDYLKNDSDVEAILVTDEMKVLVSPGLKGIFYPEDGIDVEYLY